MSENEIDVNKADIENEMETADSDESVEIQADIFENPDEEAEGFLPEVKDEESVGVSATASGVDLDSTELAAFESAEIDEVEFIEDERLESILESILFASDRPVSLASIRETFKGTNIRKDRIRRALDQIAVTFASGNRGVQLVEITGGYQLRTKLDNIEFLKRSVKARPFKLSGPALEVLSIVAYKQPVVKNEIDQIRGVESGHLLRALMEKGLCHFEGKAETLPGKPMQYGTTRRFLEIFGLRNLQELPSLSQIDELLPEGITEDEAEKPTLSTVTDSMSEQVTIVSYSQGEEELGKIESELLEISTSSDFFEQEKIREKKRKEAEKAQDIRDAMTMGEEVSTRDRNWLKKYDEMIALGDAPVALSAEASTIDAVSVENSDVMSESEPAEEEESLFSEDAEHVMDTDHLDLHEEADEGAKN